MKHLRSFQVVTSSGKPLSTRLLVSYSLLILKNVFGWLFILLAWPVGLFFPGPGGIALFLIGFTLITFPGKRALTARVMRGRRMNLHDRRFTWTAAALSLAIPPLAFWFLSSHGYSRVAALRGHGPKLLLAYIVAFVVFYILLRLLLHAVNLLFHYAPAIRRRVRPWLRRRGIRLLPPRRRSRAGVRESGDQEIIRLHERHRRRMSKVWSFTKSFLKRRFGIIFTICVFALIFRRIALQWSGIQSHIHDIRPAQFILSSFMFAGFLFVFRMLAWRHILKSLGHKLPLAASARIWATSELYRYVPGSFVQFVGRVQLCRPYGVDPATTSVSQILELAIFLLANIIVGLVCMIWLGAKIDVAARPWFFAAMALAPLLALCLYPPIFYGAIRRILARMNRPPITRQLSGWSLLGLLAWSIVGLLWQGLAIWLVTHESLGLKPDHWWIVTGSYCLAWCAGFLAFWASGGLGVREPVFVAAAQIALPLSVRARLADPAGLLLFLSLVLRLWTILGELILTAFAYVADYRGALARRDAPGRIT